MSGAATRGEADDRARWQAWRALLAEEALPVALVDLDALERNLGVVVARLAPDVTLRIASKSIRHVGLLRRLLGGAGARLRGILCFSAHEAAFLAAEGFDDLLIAYPFARRDEADVVARLAATGATVLPTVDHPDHVHLLDEAARTAGTRITTCLDIDLSWRPLGGVAHLGVRRSPVRGARDALAVARAVEASDRVRLGAVLAYEAQVAGMRDHTPGSRHLDPVRRLIKRRSVTLAARRRAEVVEALRAAGHDIAIVNGGGTGSVGSTSHDGTVTEVTAGSGFLGPHLFDGYDGLSLEPAALFALAVVRTSDEGFVTCAGGGYLASGPPGPDRAPQVWLPKGLEPLDLEGWGEVQTPLRWTGPGPGPGLGDPVLARHAKAGELAERFATYLLIRDGRIVGREPTYRGMGRAFF